MVDGKKNMHADAITYERFSEKQSSSRPTTADALARLAADKDGRLLRLARRLLLLLDDVGEIADAEDSVDMQLDSDSALFATQELFEQQEQQEEDRLVLPPDYEYLEEALSNNWL